MANARTDGLSIHSTGILVRDIGHEPTFGRLEETDEIDGHEEREDDRMGTEELIEVGDLSACHLDLPHHNTSRYCCQGISIWSIMHGYPNICRSWFIIMSIETLGGVHHSFHSKICFSLKNTIVMLGFIRMFVKIFNLDFVNCLDHDLDQEED